MPFDATPAPPPIKPGAATVSTAVKRGRGRPPKQTAQNTADLLQRRTDGVAGFFTLVSGSLLLTGNIADGAAVAQHAPNIATEAAKLAEQNAQVAKIVDFLSQTGGPVAGLVFAILPLGLQILVNHDKIPASPALENFGVKSPKSLVLELQTKAAQEQAEMAEKQAELRRQHDAAMAKLAEQQSQGTAA